MHAFRRLLITEMRNRRNIILITLGAGVLLNAAISIILSQLDRLPESLGIITILNIIVFTAMLFIPFLHSFTVWREEWKQHTIYHLLALPVPRIYLIMSKYISILIEVLLILLVTIMSLWVQYQISDGLLFRAEPLVTFDWSKALLVMNWLLSASSLVFLCSMSVLLGKCSGKVSLLITFLSFVAGLFVWIIAFANFPSTFTLIVMVLVYYFLYLYLLEKKVVVE